MFLQMRYECRIFQRILLRRWSSIQCGTWIVRSCYYVINSCQNYNNINVNNNRMLLKSTESHELLYVTVLNLYIPKAKDLKHNIYFSIVWTCLLPHNPLFTFHVTFENPVMSTNQVAAYMAIGSSHNFPYIL